MVRPGLLRGAAAAAKLGNDSQGGRVSLSVQARDRSGNVFARRLVGSAAEALAISTIWVMQNPGLVVEVVGLHE
jgi:hypothetical protein